MVPRTAMPLRPGLGISQKGFGLSTGGSLGCFLTDNKSGDTVLVSNQHVLAYYNSGFWPNQSEKDAESQVIQPDGSEINAYVIQRSTWQNINDSFTELGIPFGRSSSDTLAIAQERLTAAIADRCVVAKFLAGQLKGDL